MGQVLRGYQSEAVECTEDAIAEGFRRVLYTVFCGGGKTTTFAEITRRYLFRGKRVLVIADRKELIEQAWQRIKDHCHLQPFEIGTEIGKVKAHSGCKVIVGSVQTCYKPHRLPEGWEPDLIITDECDLAAAKTTYPAIYKRFGVYEGRCVHVGCTGTEKRTDRQSLFAIDYDGGQVMLERKGKPASPANPTECVFEKRVSKFDMLDGIDGGWCVEPRGYSVQTKTDLTGVSVVAGEFNKKELAAKVDNNERTLLAISAWKEVAVGRPTIAFCASVEHAHHTAELFRSAGFTAEAVDGETDDWDRHKAFDRLKARKLDVFCNMGIATRGTDVPIVACILHLRPMRSWNLYMQTTSRGSRTLPGVIDKLQHATPEERKAAIAASGKPDYIVIDTCDLYEKCGDLCSVPSILDLPVKLNLEGHSVSDAKRMLDEFEEVKERVLFECPLTYTELKVKLKHVDLMRKSGAATESKWQATDWGYQFKGVPPGYGCKMVKEGDGYWLQVTNGENVILRKRGAPGHLMRKYLDEAAQKAQEAIDRHKKSLPPTSKGTYARLTTKQQNCLKANGHTKTDIDGMTYWRCTALIKQYRDSFYGKEG